MRGSLTSALWDRDTTLLALRRSPDPCINVDTRQRAPALSRPWR